ncbi:MAG: dTDP-4-dehydrorhamnose 3,5-epimerase family protein [Acidimicrobiales bacterium]|nr:dTDP-4-dehydrorhamnose 3,5-epimerase family protein [Acidimicrobiales bacterium]
MKFSFDHDATTPKGVYLLRREINVDKRGSFTRLFETDWFNKLGLDGHVTQINYSSTKIKGAVRGMHYQLPPNADAKIITCISGKVHDVVVDLRKGSDTFLKSFEVELREDSNLSLVISAGFAHGFQALTSKCELLYIHNRQYDRFLERGLHPKDPILGIEWPEKVTLLSERDDSHELLSSGWEGCEF